MHHGAVRQKTHRIGGRSIDGDEVGKGIILRGGMRRQQLAVLPDGNHEIGARADRPDILPAGHGFIGMVSGGDQRSVGKQRDGIIIGAGNRDNAAPFPDIALAVFVGARGNDRAILLETDGMVSAGIHGCDVAPGIHLALAVVIETGGNDRAVLPEADGMIEACRQHLTGQGGAHGGEIGPLRDLPVRKTRCGGNGGCRIVDAGDLHGDIPRALLGVGKGIQLQKHRERLGYVSVTVGILRLMIPAGIIHRHGVGIPRKRIKHALRLGIIAPGIDLHRELIAAGQDHRLAVRVIAQLGKALLCLFIVALFVDGQGDPVAAFVRHGFRLVRGIQPGQDPIRLRIAAPLHQ